MHPEREIDRSAIFERVVEPCLNELLLPGELDDVSLDWHDKTVRRLRDGIAPPSGVVRLEPGDFDEDVERRLVLVVTVRGETFSQVMVSPDSPLAPDAEIHDRLYNAMQDFISESRFGWGEWRGRR